MKAILQGGLLLTWEVQLGPDQPLGIIFEADEVVVPPLDIGIEDAAVLAAVLSVLNIKAVHQLGILMTHTETTTILQKEDQMKDPGIVVQARILIAAKGPLIVARLVPNITLA